MIELSHISRVICPTLSRQLYMQAKQYLDVIDFTLGDPDITTPMGICDAAMGSIRLGKTHYTPNAGMPELRKLLADRINNQYCYRCTEDNVIIGIGATEILYLLFKAILNDNDEVIIISPHWVQYENQVKLNGAKPIIVKNIDEVPAAIHNGRTKAIVLNNPNNPSGKVYDFQSLQMIAEVAVKNDILIISDEVYKTLVYEKEFHSMAKFCDLENVVLIDSMSKAFAMTGWRVGYAIANMNLIQTMIKLQQNVAVSTPTSSQCAAIEAIKHYDEYAKQVYEVFAHRRIVLRNALTQYKIDCAPLDGTFYAWIKIAPYGIKSLEFATKLLQQEHVAVVPGLAFGADWDGYIRLAYTLEDEQIVKGIEKLSHFIKTNTKR